MYIACLDRHSLLVTLRCSTLAARNIGALLLRGARSVWRPLAMASASAASARSVWRQRVASGSCR